jgi:hypothetical protein
MFCIQHVRFTLLPGENEARRGTQEAGALKK